MSLTGNQALKRLKKGNSRFVQGLVSIDHMPTIGRLKELSQKGQKPFCILLSCSDSRAPAELIFDQGLGDLFVIRVAGNIIAPSQIASMELAATLFETPLIVVMGHSQCGAIQISVNQVRKPKAFVSKHHKELFKHIQPALLKHKKELMKQATPSRELIDECSRDNVEHTLHELLQQSKVLKKLIKTGKILLVGAFFDLTTGKVSFAKKS
jgi:carbonic anhydrase